jgi:cyclopropane fatty-acyl-phospholipid synthase-like methyltransferase
MSKNNWNQIYLSTKSYKKLPWIRTNIPLWFKEIIDSSWIKPCKTLDLGCGNGYYSNYLSKKGYEVTGIDISKEIIEYANKEYKNKNLKFIKADVFSKELLKDKYEFLLDVGLFHNILPEKRKEYSKRVSDLLENNGKMLVFCFDKREKTFNNKDYYLNTLINITSYPLSKIEIINTFKENFIIQKIKPIRYGTKNYKRRFLCYLEKKD